MPDIVPGSGVVGGLPWVEDTNSPVSIESGTAEVDYSISETYDRVRVVFTDVRGSSGVEDLNLQVNNNTGTNYFQINEDGTETGSASSWTVTNSDSLYGVAGSLDLLTIKEGSSDRVGVANTGLTCFEANSIMQQGWSFNTSKPSSFQLSYPTNTFESGTIRVYGFNP